MDIRGKGLFWGVEFVKDKVTNSGFLPEERISEKIKDLALSSPYNLCVYPCAGNNDGTHGDQVIIAPPFIITREQVDKLVTRLHDVIVKTFADWFLSLFVCLKNRKKNKKYFK
jgi:adenosylmethionine-8-amino-7-oxononanoate aminotransferase